MLTHKKINKICRRYKKIISYYAANKEYEDALLAARYFCIFLHTINQVLVDEELEEILRRISSELYPEEHIKVENNGVLLYDSIGVDNMALSVQYLTALVNVKKHFTYILIDSKRNRKLLELAHGSPFCNLVLLPKDNNCMELANKIRNAVAVAMPDKVILHMNNSDTVGFVAFYGIKGPEKYFVNHGDEQFWIGKSILDYSLEFRSVGKDISTRLRNIPFENIFYQPYYPLIERGNYQGLPKNMNNCLKLFGGGGDLLKYMDAIRPIWKWYTMCCKNTRMLASFLLGVVTVSRCIIT